MNRYFLNHTHCDYCYSAVMDTDDQGDYVLFADIEPIIADRDIKAANLQLLVEKVLAYNETAESFADGPPYEGAELDAARGWSALIELARGLKQ